MAFANNLHAQSISFGKNNIEPVNVFMSVEKMMGKEVVRVIKDSSVKEADEPTFVKIKGTNFRNGTIEVKVLSRLLKNAPDFARGFIGIAFRINDSNFIRCSVGETLNRATPATAAGLYRASAKAR